MRSRNSLAKEAGTPPSPEREPQPKGPPDNEKRVKRASERKNESRQCDEYSDYSPERGSGNGEATTQVTKH